MPTEVEGPPRATILILGILGLAAAPLAACTGPGSARTGSPPRERVVTEPVPEPPADPPSAEPGLDDPTAPKVPPKPKVAQRTPKNLYEAYCGACHDLKLVELQRLDKGTWEWVMEDMVGKYGATWITAEEQEVIVDYLAENFGREKKR